MMGSASAAELVQAVEKAGYGAEAIEDDLQRRERQQETALATMKRFRWQAIVALLVGVPVMVWGMIGDNMMVSDDNRSLWLVIGLVTLAVMVFAGDHFYRSAWKSLKNGTATMDTLVALGTGVARLYSMSVNLWPQWFPMEARHLYYEASAMIIGLINLGHMLEARARQRSSKALEKLLDLTPPSARVVTPEGEKDLPLAEVQAGMTLRLTTGDRVPVDGMISRGRSLGLMKRCSPANRCRSKRRWRRHSRRDRGAGWQRAVYRQRRRQPDHAGKNYPHGAPGAEQQTGDRPAGG